MESHTNPPTPQQQTATPEVKLTITPSKAVMWMRRYKEEVDANAALKRELAAAQAERDERTDENTILIKKLAVTQAELAVSQDSLADAQNAVRIFEQRLALACGKDEQLKGALAASERLCDELAGALHDAASYVENLAGRDNSCDLGCDEELTEWRSIIARHASARRA